MADRGAAMREEARIKRLERSAKLALIAAEGVSEGPPEGRAGVAGGVAA